MKKILVALAFITCLAGLSSGRNNALPPWGVRYDYGTGKSTGTLNGRLEVYRSTAAVNPDFVLDNGQMTFPDGSVQTGAAPTSFGQLSGSTTVNADTLDGLHGSSVSLKTDVLASTAALSGRLDAVAVSTTTEKSERVAADAALSTSIAATATSTGTVQTALDAHIASNQASFQSVALSTTSESNARSTADSALSERIAATSVSTGTVKSELDAHAAQNLSGFAAVAASTTTEQFERVAADSALADDIAALKASTGTVNNALYASTAAYSNDSDTVDTYHAESFGRLDSMNTWSNIQRFNNGGIFDTHPSFETYTELYGHSFDLFTFGSDPWTDYAGYPFALSWSYSRNRLEFHDGRGDAGLLRLAAKFVGDGSEIVNVSTASYAPEAGHALSADNSTNSSNADYASLSADVESPDVMRKTTYDTDDDGVVDNAAYAGEAGYSYSTAAHTHNGSDVNPATSMTVSSFTNTGNSTMGSNSTTSLQTTIGDTEQRQIAATNIAAILTQTVIAPIDVIADNDYAYVLCESTYMAIYETVGSTIAFRGRFGSTEMRGASHLVKKGNVVAISCSNSHRVLLVDVANPYDPKLAGIIADHLSTPRCSAWVGDILWVVNFGGTAALGGFMAAFDCSNPASPKYITSIRNSSGQWVEAEGTYLYTIPRYGDNLLRIFDVKDPYHPILLSASSYNMSNPSVCKPKGDGRLLAISDTYNNKIKLIDISDKYHPVWISTFTSGYMNGAMRLSWEKDNLLYGCWATHGIGMADFRDPKNPQFVATFKMTNNVGGAVFVSKNRLMGVSSAANELKIFQLTSQQAPNINVGIVTAGDTSVNGNLVVSRDVSVNGSIASGSNISAEGAVVAKSSTTPNYFGSKLGVGMSAKERLSVFGNCEFVDDSTVGANSLSDPSFDDATKWVLGTGWTIAESSATFKSASAYVTLSQAADKLAVPLKAGRYYRLWYTVSNIRGGIISATPTTPGSGYTTNSFFRIAGGDGNAVGKPTYVNASGGITQLETTYGGATPGSNYLPGMTDLETTTVTGTGSGATITVLQVAAIIALTVTTSTAEEETPMAVSEGRHYVIFRANSNPTIFRLAASADGSQNASFALDDLVLEELQGGDIRAHQNLRGSGVRYDTNIYTVGVTTPTATHIEMWTSDYKKYISTGTSNAWDWLQIYP